MIRIKKDLRYSVQQNPALRGGPRPDEPVQLDLPIPNTAAVDLATAAGMRPVFRTARMYRGPGPDLPLEQIYGITSFELG